MNLEPPCHIAGCPEHDPAYILDYNWLVFQHESIHYFGLGFIQIKLSQYQRMHFYTKELPSIMSEEEIHNHRYNFRSYIVKGSIKQDIFLCMPLQGSYFVEPTTCKKDSEPSAISGYDCEPILYCSSNYEKKSSYTLEHNVMHRVYSENAITFIHRGPYKKDYAWIAREKGTTKVCPFSKEIAKEDLWRIVKEML